jgi:2-polyprenyl-3-methyl-5-hydroxy-6-metoxy-1,4-benzoquinol methylase
VEAPIPDPATGPESTELAGAAYAERLERLAGARWKRWLDVQAPYRWNLRRLHLGRTLDLGCGIGRNLLHLPAGSVGVDTNPHAVAAAQRRGCEAYEPAAFSSSPRARERFDTLLCAHVLEHMSRREAEALLRAWLSRVCPGGRVVLIAPQPAGFRSDPTHVEYLDPDALRSLLERIGCVADRVRSFPLPRGAGRVFRYNEWVAVGRIPEPGT